MGKRIMLLGLLGTIGSGKTTISDYLLKKGFKRVVMGDLVREKARKEGVPLTRENLQKIQRRYRSQYGREVFIREAIRRLKRSGKTHLLIDGIRTPFDAAEAKKAGAILLLIDARKAVRFARIKARAREGEGSESMKKFLEDEKREWELFEFRKTANHVDYRIDNSATVGELQKNVDAVLAKILKKRNTFKS